jgi:hypothetical protein
MQKHTLAYPVTFGDALYRDVTIRRPKGRDIIAIEDARARTESDTRSGFVAISILCDIPEGVVEEMDAQDIAALSDRVASFFVRPGDPATAS